MKLRGALRKSFLERNQLVIGIAGVLVVGGLTAFSLLLSGGFFADTYTVKAVFADAAGIKNGDDVIVAGLDAGSVEAVTVEDGHVVIDLEVDKKVVMPSDTRAEIHIETLMGKKAVSLVGEHEGGAKLQDGDTIPLERTRTPVELLDLANESVPLLEKSDAEALETFLTDITEITDGKQKQVGQLLVGLNRVTQAVNARSEELSRLLDSLETLSGTFAERDDTIVSLIDNLEVVLANLDARSEDIERLLEATDEASHEVADLVGRNRSTFDAALQNLHVTLLTLDQHQMDLSATISYLEQAVRGYSSVGYSQGVPNRWANIFVQSLGPLGIDAFFGPCGAFDQALDDLLGPDPRSCKERAEYGDQEDGNPRSQEDGPLPRDRTGNAGPAGEQEEDPDRPGDVGDLLEDITGGSGVVDGLRGEL